MRECEKKFVADLKNLHETGNDQVSVEEFLKNLSLMINTFSLDRKGIMEEIKKDKNASEIFTSICYQWIRKAGVSYETEYLWDERNKLSYQICNELIDSRTGKKVIFPYPEEYPFYFKGQHRIKRNIFPYPEEYPDSWKIANKKNFSIGFVTALYMSREHRTLQQTFTGLVFSYLTETDKAFRKMSKEIGREDLRALPMI